MVALVILDTQNPPCFLIATHLHNGDTVDTYNILPHMHKLVNYNTRRPIYTIQYKIYAQVFVQGLNYGYAPTSTIKHFTCGLFRTTPLISNFHFFCA